MRTNQVAGFENFHFTFAKIIKTGLKHPIHISMSQQVVTVTYDLVPPEGIPRPNLEPSTSLTRPVAPSASGCKEYYDALRAAIDEVKVVSGHELTAWRDAVGNRELGKEVNTKKEEDDEDGGEDAEGEE